MNVAYGLLSLPSGVMSDEGFDDSSNLLLLAARESSGSFEKPLHLAGWTRARFLVPLGPTTTSTETFNT